MLELDNRTPFEAALVPGTDKEGIDTVSAALKATFRIEVGVTEPEVAEEQVPLVWADEFRGEPGETSLLYEADTVPTKPSTDVVILGHVYAQGGWSRSMDVALRVGDLTRTIRVFGDRRWHRPQGFWRISDPEPFEAVPLVFERAYGGRDQTDPDEAKHDWEPRNPVGTGFVTSSGSEQADELPLPNFEDPNDLIQDLKDRPRPVGTGFVGRGWEPRVGLAGTYDESWLQNRAPLLPKDFDERFFNGAHPDWITRGLLVGGEPVFLGNMSKEGDLGFYLPKRRFEVSWCEKEVWSLADPALDTVVMEPDENRITLTWRARIPCPRKLLFIDRVKIKEVGVV